MMTHAEHRARLQKCFSMKSKLSKEIARLEEYFSVIKPLTDEVSTLMARVCIIDLATCRDLDGRIDLLIDRHTQEIINKTPIANQEVDQIERLAKIIG